MSSKTRLNVHLYVTPICNLHCKHCYYDAWPVDGLPERLLTIQEMALIITSLCDNYAAAFDVEGGEFFLREDIAELFDAVPSHYWSSITVTTNGTVKIAVDPKHLLNLDEFRISLEGHTDELQKDIRGIGLDPVMETCHTLRSNGIPVTLRITLHRKNYKYLAEMVSYFASIGFSRFSLYEFQPAGRGLSQDHEYSLTESEMAEALKEMYMISLDNRLSVLKLSLSSKRVPLVLAYQGELTAHGYQILDISGIPSLTINYNGDLGVCPWRLADGDPIGTLREGEEFCADIAKYLDTGRLDHVCNHCSAIRILYQAQA